MGNSLWCKKYLSDGLKTVARANTALKFSSMKRGQVFIFDSARDQNLDFWINTLIIKLNFDGTGTMPYRHT